jgi:hypothetical protein
MNKTISKLLAEEGGGGEREIRKLYESLNPINLLCDNLYCILSTVIF